MYFSASWPNVIGSDVTFTALLALVPLLALFVPLVVVVIAAAFIGRLQVIDRTRVTKRMASAEVELYFIAKQKADQPASPIRQSPKESLPARKLEGKLSPAYLPEHA